jgi:hypothetical protein
LTDAGFLDNMARTKHELGQSIDHGAFRDLLVFSIGFVIVRDRPLLRRILTEHVSDDARRQFAKKVLAHLELPGFKIDEPRRPSRARVGRPFSLPPPTASASPYLLQVLRCGVERRTPGRRGELTLSFPQRLGPDRRGPYAERSTQLRP